MAAAGEAVVVVEEEVAGEEVEEEEVGEVVEGEVAEVGEGVDGTKEDTVDMEAMVDTEEREDGTSIDFSCVATYAVLDMNSILCVLELLLFFCFSFYEGRKHC